MEFIRLLIAFIMPPIAVYMQFGAGKQLAMNILLTLLGFVPGIVHAVYIMTAKKPGLVRREKLNRQEAAPR